MERGTPTENEMKKGGLQDTDQKSGDGQKVGGWVPFDTVPEEDWSNSIATEFFPLAKNYIIFFGAVTLMHFRGQELALPPPIQFKSQRNGDLETAWLGYLFKLIVHLILAD